VAQSTADGGVHQERERQETSFLNVLKSEEIEPPKNIGLAWMGPTQRVLLRAEDAEAFKNEIYKCIGEADSSWDVNEEAQSPQGLVLHDLAAYPHVAQYLATLHLLPRNRYSTIKGIGWLTFPAHGGAYSPRDAVDALLDVLGKKAGKYADLHKDQALTELYLVVYYDRALIHNTPFIAANFGWNEVTFIARKVIAKHPGVFQKIFLFNAVPQDRTVTVLYP
jgi:hypothetical protein